MKKFFYTLIVALLAGACQNTTTQSSPQQAAPPKTEPEPQSLNESAQAVLELLKRKDFETLVEWIHPELGVRFSPYGYVDTASNLRFSRAQFREMLANDVVRNWGQFDGSGDPIDMNFKDYYKKFIFDADFTKPEKFAENEIIGKGNSLINLDVIYPGCEFTESHFSGFYPEFGGMDWSSLRLVFRKESGRYFLVGIVHDQWTS